jgi:hypothetical protein
MKTTINLNLGKSNLEADVETPALKTSETLIRDKKSLRVRSGLRGGLKIKMAV